MTDCHHCHGTGKEPDPLADAWDALSAAIGELEDGAAVDTGRAANAYADQVQARITFLEAALRDVLSRIAVPSRRTGTNFIGSFQAPYSQLDGWHAILDGTPPHGPGILHPGYLVGEDGKVIRPLRPGE